jgi:hypothetical protein
MNRTTPALLASWLALAAHEASAENEHNIIKIGSAQPKDAVWLEGATHGCYTDPGVAAQQVCTLHRPGSSPIALRYSVPNLLSVDRGGHCGYHRYEFICYDIPTATRTKTFLVDHRNYGCGADPIPIAAPFCKITGGGAPDQQYPFTLRVTRIQYGGRCGETTYEVACRDFPTR